MGTPNLPCVLVADDDDAIRSYVTLLLEEDGYITNNAADGEAAWEILEQSEDDWVIISDYWMPRLDGEGLFARILAHPEMARRQRFILITAFGRQLPPEFEERLRTAGGIILRKPFHALETILDAVRDAPRLHV